MMCRGCGALVTESLVDLGVQPLSNAYVARAHTDEPELFYPLHPLVCSRCYFVQIGVFEQPERIFGDYAYFSSYSTSWLEHCRAQIANNVLAHVPDIHDFVEGFRRLLAPGGIATFEFPHLVPLLEQTQFDTIYHEHFSYLSLLAVEPVFAAHGLAVVDVDWLGTHGGSLRLWVARADGERVLAPTVAKLRGLEHEHGLADLATYRAFAPRVRAIKNELLRFLIEAGERGETVVAYGAAAKGNTLMNYCGIRSDLVRFVVDRNPHKQGMLLPGSRLPIEPVERLREVRPEYVLVLPWNLIDEVVGQMADVRDWGARFVVAVPRLTLI